MKSKLKDKLPASSSFEFITYDPSAATQPPPDLSVKRDGFWSYCGPLLTSEAELPPSLHDWAEAVLRGSVIPLLLPLLAFVNEFLEAEGLDHYWLTIRATKATAAFDRPRWHTDDLFFSRGGSGLTEPPPLPPSSSSSSPSHSSKPSSTTIGKKAKTKTKLLKHPNPPKSPPSPDPQTNLDLQTSWKLCATLLGPSTLFIPAAHQALALRTSHTTKRVLASRARAHACTALRCAACAATSESVRASLAHSLSKLGVARAKRGQAAVFRIGGERGAVHSEPALSGDDGNGNGDGSGNGDGNGDRVFVNVVPGRGGELAGLVRRWGMSFPRSWWIAPGVGREGR